MNDDEANEILARAYPNPDDSSGNALLGVLYACITTVLLVCAALAILWWAL